MYIKRVNPHPYSPMEEAEVKAEAEAPVASNNVIAAPAPDVGGAASNNVIARGDGAGATGVVDAKSGAVQFKNKQEK